MVVAVPYLLIEGIHPATQEIYRNGELTTARPIVATGALVILQCAVLALGLGWPSRRAAVRIAIAAGIVVLLLEHRTLWVAGLAVGLTVLFWWFKERSRSRSFAAFGVTGLVLLILPLAVWGASQSQALTASFNEATTSNSTFTWRTTSWQELISSHHSVSQLVYGAPAGASWPRLINGQVVTASPHDGFVDAYLRFGLPGLSVLCALGLLLWRRRTAIAAGTGLTADAIGLLLLTQLVFSIAYTLDPVQGIIDGLLVSGLAAARTVQAPVLRQSRPTGLEYDLAEL
jgi:O-antigen ligase